MALTALNAARIIRERAAASENVVFTEHAMQQMQERDISVSEVFQILREGGVLAPPRLECGEWKVEVDCDLSDGEAAAVTIIAGVNGLRVVTVMWR